MIWHSWKHSSLELWLTLEALTAPFFINGCLRSSLAKGLCSKSLTNSSETKSVSRGQSDLSSVGGGLRGIWNKARMGCSSDRGGSPWASSIAVIPRDQMSHRASYQESSCCSQAITYNKMLTISLKRLVFEILWHLIWVLM